MTVQNRLYVNLTHYSLRSTSLESLRLQINVRLLF
jgi:hypothetical protein